MFLVSIVSQMQKVFHTDPTRDITLLEGAPRKKEEISPSFRLCTNFSKILSVPFLSEVFTKQGWMGMFEAFYYNSVDEASSNLGIISDIMRGNNTWVEVTTLFTKYVELLRCPRKFIRTQRWLRERTRFLRIKSFKIQDNWDITFRKVSVICYGHARVASSRTLSRCYSWDKKTWVFPYQVVWKGL